MLARDCGGLIEKTGFNYFYQLLFFISNCCIVFFILGQWCDRQTSLNVYSSTPNVYPLRMYLLLDLIGLIL
jgi:hypothetical protein